MMTCPPLEAMIFAVASPIPDEPPIVAKSGPSWRESDACVDHTCDNCSLPIQLRYVALFDLDSRHDVNLHSFNDSRGKDRVCSQLAGYDVEMDLCNTKSILRNSPACLTMHLGNIELMYTQTGASACACHTNPCDRGV